MDTGPEILQKTRHATAETDFASRPAYKVEIQYLRLLPVIERIAFCNDDLLACIFHKHLSFICRIKAVRVSLYLAVVTVCCSLTFLQLCDSLDAWYPSPGAKIA